MYIHADEANGMMSFLTRPGAALLEFLFASIIIKSDNKHDKRGTMMSNSDKTDTPSSKGWKRWGGVGALLIAFGSKFKTILPLLKLGKYGGTLWSMALMIGTYALIAPWTFAIGIVIMIFIHEMGHVIAAKRMGIPVSAPTFIPFIGALISMKKQPQNAQNEAYLAMGGPVMGTIGAVACFGLAEWTGYAPLYSVALIGFFLNLINLLPIHPLDGGRIVTAISRWMWLVGLIGGLVIILFYLRSILFLFIWGLFAWELFNTFILKRKKRDDFLDMYMQTLEDVDTSLFRDAGMPVPGEQHKRPLPFRQYCDVGSKEHLLELFYPGVGSIGRLPFSPLEEEKVEKVALEETKPAGPSAVQMTIAVYCAHNPDKYPSLDREDYYDVPVKTRILYGVGYFGLAAFLIIMMMAVYSSDAMHAI